MTTPSVRRDAFSIQITHSDDKMVFFRVDLVNTSHDKIVMSDMRLAQSSLVSEECVQMLLEVLDLPLSKVNFVIKDICPQSEMEMPLGYRRVTAIHDGIVTLLSEALSRVGFIRANSYINAQGYKDKFDSVISFHPLR